MSRTMKEDAIFHDKAYGCAQNMAREKQADEKPSAQVIEFPPTEADLKAGDGRMML